MFFNSFMPKPTFGSSGSSKGGSKRSSTADRKGAAATFSAPKPVYRPATTTKKRSTVPSSSPTPKIRPASLNTGGLSSPTPRIRPASLNTGGLSSPTPRIRPANLGATGSNFGLKAPNAANSVGRRSAPTAPVNISADTSTSSAGSAAGSSGGASGKVKASKTQEENVSVRKKARGTSKYQVTRASKNPLVVNKKKTKVV